MNKNMTFTNLINNKFNSTKAVGLEELLEGQIKLGIVIPPDYCYLLLNSNGYSCKTGLQITIDKITPIVEIDDFVNLEWLIKEREYDLDDEDAELYRDKFIRIAGCLNQDRVLMGYSEDVLNEIHLLDFDDDKTVKICNSIFEFINNYLIKI